MKRSLWFLGGFVLLAGAACTQPKNVAPANIDAELKAARARRNYILDSDRRAKMQSRGHAPGR